MHVLGELGEEVRREDVDPLLDLPIERPVRIRLAALELVEQVPDAMVLCCVVFRMGGWLVAHPSVKKADAHASMHLGQTHARTYLKWKSITLSLRNSPGASRSRSSVVTVTRSASSSSRGNLKSSCGGGGGRTVRGG